jgi:membrane fusion protein (multidrug efflux system)
MHLAQRMNHSNRLKTSALTVTLVLATGVLGCQRPRARPASGPPKVVIALAERRDVELTTDVVGAVDGYVNAEIRARERGVLKAQLYRDGAAVKAGQALFLLDRAEYDAAVEAARAAVARAEAADAHARAQLARRTDLGASRVVSQQEIEDAQAAARDSEGQLRATQAQLRQAQLNLSYTQIRSPVAGVAGIANVRVGNLVGQDGPTLLTTVSQVDPIRVTFPLNETEYVLSRARFEAVKRRNPAETAARLADLRRGDVGAAGDERVDLVLADGSAYSHFGVVVAFNRQIDPTTGTIALQALFPNPGNFLRPGQFARVRSHRRRAGAIVVPEAAIIEVQGTYELAVVGAGNTVRLRRVEVGPLVDGVRVIAKGVEPGEAVVVGGVQKVRDGSVVVASLAKSTDAAHAANTRTP